MSDVETGYALVGSLESLSRKELSRLKRNILSQTRRIWAEGAQLGDGSKLLTNAVHRLNTLKQYRTSEDDDDAELFRELLFRAWYNVWRARDYSIEGIAKRLDFEADPDLAKRWNNYRANGIEAYSARFSPLHIPKIDPFNLSVLNRTFVEVDFQLHQYSLSLLEGALSSYHISHWYKRLRTKLSCNFVEFAFLTDQCIGDLDHASDCWMELDSGISNLASVPRSIVNGSMELKEARVQSLHQTPFCQTRFEGDLRAHDSRLGTVKDDFFNDIYVSGCFQFPNVVNQNDICVRPQKQVGLLEFRLRNAQNLTIEGGESSIKIDAGSARDLGSVTISECRASLLEIGPSFGDVRISSLKIVNCTFERFSCFLDAKINQIIQCCLGEVANDGFVDGIVPSVRFMSHDISTGRRSVLLSETVFAGAVEFKGQSIFDFTATGCVFENSFDAKNLHVEGRIWFGIGRSGDTSFKKNCDLSSERVDDKSFRISSLYFNGVSFFGDLDVSNRNFAGTTEIELCEFHSAPIFHGAKFHQDTSFRASKFLWQDESSLDRWRETLSIKLWPDLQRYRKDNLRFYERWRLAVSVFFFRIFYPFFYGGAWGEQLQVRRSSDEMLGRYERAFRTLRQGMEGHNAAEEAGLFHLQEMRARHARRNDRSVHWSERIAGQTYDVLSEYGSSFLRPIGFFSLTFLVFAGVYHLLSLVGRSGADLGASLMASMTMMVRPFVQYNPAYSSSRMDVNSGEMNSHELIAWFVQNHEVAFKLISTFQSLFAVVLIFLALLALRRRFQMN